MPSRRSLFRAHCYQIQAVVVPLPGEAGILLRVRSWRCGCGQHPPHPRGQLIPRPCSLAGWQDKTKRSSCVSVPSNNWQCYRLFGKKEY